MASDNANNGGKGPAWTNYFKSVLGYGAPQPGALRGAASPIQAANAVSAEQQQQGPPGSRPAASAAPTPIRTRAERQDSMPEMVSTPTDVGIWEIGHGMRTGQFTWKRLFQDPRTYTGTDSVGNKAAGPASPSKR